MMVEWLQHLQSLDDLQTWTWTIRGREKILESVEGMEAEDEKEDEKERQGPGGGWYKYHVVPSIEWT